MGNGNKHSLPQCEGTGYESSDPSVGTPKNVMEEKVPTAILSGGVAGIAGRTFVMTLPGSTGGVKDGIALLEPVLHHIVALLEGTPGH